MGLVVVLSGNVQGNFLKMKGLLFLWFSKLCVVKVIQLHGYKNVGTKGGKEYTPTDSLPRVDI